MRCRHCGLEIERFPLEDGNVRFAYANNPLIRPTNKVNEAWITVGEIWLSCEQNWVLVGEPYTYHEPMLETVDQMLLELLAIESDLK